MPDYDHDIETGVFLTPDASRPHQLLETAQRAEVLGYDLVTLQDHPYNPGQLDAFAMLAMIAARTSTVRVAPNVACLPLRSPTVLAGALASLSLGTGGRVEAGLGAGAFWDAIEAAGGPRRSPAEAVDALIEAVWIIRECWRGGAVNLEGKHYRVHGYQGGPVPAQPIPIWLGAYKPRMLRVTGQLADGWVPSMGYADPPALAELNARIDEAALEAGRSPAAIKRLYNIVGRFGAGAGFLQGRPRDWAEQLAQLSVETGMSSYILGSDDPTTLRVFAEEVVPDLRDQVAAARAGQVTTQPATAAPVSTQAVAEPASLQLIVAPTPDDGHRLTGELDWNEAARPHGPGGWLADFPLAAQANSAHLVEIHDHLRGELQQVRSVLDQVRAGQLAIGAARSVINQMALRQNNWTLGAFCESYCRLVTGHHTLEDRSIFPYLRSRDERLAPVIDRLEHEHEVIADVLDALDRALVGLVDADPHAAHEALAELQLQVDLLTDTLLSHLAYEERELLVPLAEFGFG